VVVPEVIAGGDVEVVELVLAEANGGDVGAGEGEVPGAFFEGGGFGRSARCGRRRSAFRGMRQVASGEEERRKQRAEDQSFHDPLIIGWRTIKECADSPASSGGPSGLRRRASSSGA